MFYSQKKNEIFFSAVSPASGTLRLIIVGSEARLFFSAVSPASGTLRLIILESEARLH